MTSYRFIGTGTTDASGVARLTKDPQGQTINGYVGSGNGEIDFVASLDNPIVDGSIVSEPSSVLDAIFKDIGTSTNYGTWTSTDFTGSKISRNDEYTTLTPEDDFDSQYLALADSDLCIEFDMNITYTATNYFLRFVKNQWTATASLNQTDLSINSNEWHHIKLVKTGNTVRIFVDNVEKPSKTLLDTTDGFRLILTNVQATDMKYKNFVVYPI